MLLKLLTAYTLEDLALFWAIPETARVICAACMSMQLASFSGICSGKQLLRGDRGIPRRLLLLLLMLVMMISPR